VAFGHIQSGSSTRSSSRNTPIWLATIFIPTPTVAVQSRSAKANPDAAREKPPTRSQAQGTDPVRTRRTSDRREACIAYPAMIATASLESLLDTVYFTYARTCRAARGAAAVERRPATARTEFQPTSPTHESFRPEPLAAVLLRQHDAAIRHSWSARAAITCARSHTSRCPLGADFRPARAGQRDAQRFYPKWARFI